MEFLTGLPFRFGAGILGLFWLTWIYRRGVPMGGGRLLGVLLGLVALIAATLPLGVALVMGVLAAAEFFWWLRGRQGRRRDYTPARARFEGGGIKRGLTAAEAGVLLGRPLHLILAVALMEMLQKGLLVQLVDSPFEAGVAGELQTRQQSLNIERRAVLRRAGAQKIGATLHPFEEPLLELLEQEAGKPVSALDFGLAVPALVRHVAGRVAGYGLEETRDYYQRIVQRAPVEARTEGVLMKDRQKVFDRNLGWILLNPKCVEILDGGDESYLPGWLRERNSVNGTSFAKWFIGVVDILQGVYTADDLNLKLGDAVDSVSAELMNNIAQATYYG